MIYINNYRPISILPMVNKIIERAIYNRIVSFLETNKFFYRSQFGFRAGMGTRTATCEIVDRVQREMDGGRTSSAIFMDLSKAFDTVSHEILLLKMEKAGIRGIALKLIEHYLTNRKIIVDVDGERSNEYIVPVGVGQGSILGPLFYLIYYNHIGKLQLNGELSLFADDTAVFYFDSDHQRIRESMQYDMTPGEISGPYHRRQSQLETAHREYKKKNRRPSWNHCQTEQFRAKTRSESNLYTAT